jgi:hypothetical protein
MRNLQIEELELVAGGVDTPAGEVSQSTKNNGLGNYDQGAPGTSFTHNGAENRGDAVTTGNPPGSGNFPVVPNL